jgi:CHAT domain-containing protein
MLALQPESHRRRQLLQAGREWWKPETVARLYDEVVRLVRVDLRQAERLARAAAWIAAQIDDEGSRAASLRALRHVFYLKRKYEPARQHYQAALAIYQRLGMELDVGRTISGSLQTLIYLGRYDEAFACAERAQTIFLKHGDHLRLARLDTNMGNILHRQDRFEEALERYQRAYTTFARIGDPSESAFQFFSPSPLGGKAALCQLLLARIHLDTGHGEEAKRVCLAALQKLEHAETPALSCQAYFVLGLIEEALGAPEAAYEAYLKAHERLENLRSHLKADEMKIAFLKDKLAVYESLVRMCLGRGPSAANVEAAFAYIEQAKSRSLADLIAFRAHRLPASRKTRRALVEQVDSLRGELNWYSRTIQHVEGRSANLEGPRLEKLRRAARDCEQRLVESLANLRVEDQEFANLEAAGSIGLETIRSALPEDAMLVEYYRAGDAFCVCLLSRGDLKIVELGPAPALRRILQLLRFQLSKFRLGPEYVRTFQQQLLEAANEHLREFYRQLIAPVASHLEEAAHLIIAPHGFLHYLPFHALFDGERYPGDRFSISYTPSASVYYLCSTKSAPPAAGALVLGVPDPSAPHILDEVKAVSSVLSNAEVFTGAEATLEVLREKGSQCRFVHIATHGWFRQDSPMFSSISLGDSQLSLFDLYQLDLPSELVTLSGCGTGLNVVVGGDELLGLVRGLLYASAQGVLVTLWDVNDQSTAEFMKLFYEHLETNPNKAQAVQPATAEIRKKYAHPFYWAPFVLVGKYG